MTVSDAELRALKAARARFENATTVEEQWAAHRDWVALGGRPGYRPAPMAEPEPPKVNRKANAERRRFYREQGLIR